MVSLKTIKKRLKTGPKSTGCNTITPVNSDQNGIRGTENPACDIWASETDFDSVQKIDSTTHRQLSLPEVKSTTHNELDIKGNFLQERSHQGSTDQYRSVSRPSHETVLCWTNFGYNNASLTIPKKKEI